MASDVFAEEEPGADVAGDPPDVGPQVPRILDASTPAGVGERLARVSRNDAIHEAAPRFRIEGSDVRPHRCRIQGAVRHARDQKCGGRGFPLHESHAPGSRYGKGDAEVKAADAGTK